MKKLRFSLATLALATGLAGAGEFEASSPQPRTLSEERIEGYLSGKGMGLARAAELNHYPGPRHVLDLAEPLALSSEQRAATEALFQAMQHDAQAIGRQILAKEEQLERRFNRGEINRANLRILLNEIGALEAALRYTHLQTHLAQRALLSEAQIEDYDRLRGYTAAELPASGTGAAQSQHHGH